MTSGKRISIPWKQRWQRFRYSVLPLLSFVACVALMLWMWSREVHVASTVGEVEWQRFDVTAGAGGKLLSLDHPPWTLFEHVEVNWASPSWRPARETKSSGVTLCRHCALERAVQCCTPSPHPIPRKTAPPVVAAGCNGSGKLQDMLCFTTKAAHVSWPNVMTRRPFEQG